MNVDWWAVALGAVLNLLFYALGYARGQRDEARRAIGPTRISVRPVVRIDPGETAQGFKNTGTSPRYTYGNNE